MNKSILLVVVLGLATAAALREEEYQVLFSKWVAQHNKKYSHDTFFYRYTVFKSNMDMIIAHNKKGKSYTLAMNDMGDLTKAEFKAQKTGYNYIKNSHMRSRNGPAAPKKPFKLPRGAACDWTTGKGCTPSMVAVTPIKNQQQCGSCWSFSATGALEGAYAIKHKSLVSFSEEQFVDCAQAEGNQGCEGGLMDQAFQYVMDNKGYLCQENDYPYTAADGTCGLQTGTNQCPPSPQGDGAKEIQTGITGFTDVTSGDENALLKAASMGPVSIAIEADQAVFQFYSGGIMDDASCGTQLDHGVLVVGYGTENGVDYWKVKNSWGNTWGEEGFVRMVRNKDQCGLATQPSYPVL
jgi:cathepsin L